MTESVKGIYSIPQKENSCFKINIKALNCLLCLIAAAAGVYYLTAINDLVVKSFVLQELKANNSSLQEENKSLNNQVADIKSYKELAERVKALNMVSAADIEYLKVGDNSLAAVK